MRATTLIKAIALTALLAGMSAAGVKYVAVVETEIDAQSGASANLNPAEVREITAEIRRQAIENLPSDRYSVMTSETVQSMGGAVLEECADENCVITLGSKIGADYIVRGTIGKFQTRFTLKVEMYETDNGTLVATSEPVRTENVGEILDMATGACGKMFGKFAGRKESITQKQSVAIADGVGQQTEPKSESHEISPVQTVTFPRGRGYKKPDKEHVHSNNSTPKKRKHDYYIAPKYQFPVGTPILWGAVNVEGGWIWGNGAFFGIDFNFGYGEDYIYYENLDMTGTVTSGERLFLGGGLSVGDVYDFGNQLQFVYGGSAGCWYVDGEHGKNISILAPFIKWRWRFMEITYRGLLGVNDNGNMDIFGWNNFGWNYHQLMLGLYFATSKRTTR